MIEENLLALLVVTPLLAAPVCFLLPNNRAPWLLATLVSWAVLALAVFAVLRVTETGSLSYSMGGWSPPWGIEYRMDSLNAFFAVLISLIGAVVMPFAAASVDREIDHGQRAGFYAAYLLTLAGLLGITITGDVFNLFVFLEISSLASYTLISLADDRRALVAAFHYLILGTIGATFILIGVGLAYSQTGTLNMIDMAQRLAEIQHSRTIHTAFAFMAVGAAIKLALFPLHVWLPNAYTYAPSAVSAFLAATTTKVMFYIITRFIYTVFGEHFIFETTPFGLDFTALGLAGVICASIIAIFQNDVKRLLAYSSIAQVGYMVLGLSMATAMGLMAGILHVFNHALMKGALFMATGCVVYRLGSARIDSIAGLARDMPWTMAAFAIAGLSLIGVPPSVGFISKWYLVGAALENGWWPIAFVIVASSLLAVIYIWKVVETVWLKEPDTQRPRVSEAPLSMLLPTWALVLANIYFGIDTRFTVGMATSAAQSLTGGTP